MGFSLKTARWLFALSGVLGTLCTLALVWYGISNGGFRPPYTGAVGIFGLLFLTSLACLIGIRRPARRLATVAAGVFFGLGLLLAPSTGGLFQFLAIPVGCVAVFGFTPSTGHHG